MNEWGASDRRRLGSALLFALVLAAAGSLALQVQELMPTALLVVIGACLVGGILPTRWWLGAVVGLGVPLAHLWAPTTSEPSAMPGMSSASTWIAPAIALAAAGLGAALVRHLREE